VRGLKGSGRLIESITASEVVTEKQRINAAFHLTLTYSISLGSDWCMNVSQRVTTTALRQKSPSK